MAILMDFNLNFLTVNDWTIIIIIIINDNVYNVYYGQIYNIDCLNKVL